VIQALLCHPQTPCSVPLSIGATVTRAPDADVLCVRYRVVCDLSLIRNTMHETREVPARRDGLWQSTCLECFVQFEGSAAGYYEFNVALNGDWAAYRFDAYREGMQSVAIAQPALEYRACEPDVALIDLRFDFASSPELGRHRGAFRLGICAVVETLDGLRSYWALHHPEGKPDFHRREGFVLRVAC
jgi:hypothetical protein